jgi:hypothetical protein
MTTESIAHGSQAAKAWLIDRALDLLSSLVELALTSVFTLGDQTFKNKINAAIEADAEMTSVT